jgi:hypothetical protein
MGNETLFAGNKPLSAGNKFLTLGAQEDSIKLDVFGT